MPAHCLGAHVPTALEALVINTEPAYSRGQCTAKVVGGGGGEGALGTGFWSSVSICQRLLLITRSPWDPKGEKTAMLRASRPLLHSFASRDFGEVRYFEESYIN